MYKVEAVIRHFKLDEVREALADKGIVAMTVTEVRGIGQPRSNPFHQLVDVSASDLLPKVKLEIYCLAEEVMFVKKSILRSARTGQVGDGIVATMPLSSCYQITEGKQLI